MRTAVQLTGLGGYVPGVLRQWITTEPRVSAIVSEVDSVAREYAIAPVSLPLTDPDGPDAEELAKTPTRLHLAAMVSGLALYALLAERRCGRHVLVGHSTGELTALVAAGCLSVHDAARVVCEREIALAAGDFAGGLTALRISAKRAEHLCGTVGGWTLRPSLFNAPHQTVVSGDAEELPTLEKAARALGIQATRLLVVYPHHNPMLAAAARQLAEATAAYRVHEPVVPVFSPLLGRPIRSAEDVRRVIDRHLTDPVNYLGAIRALHADHEVDTFLEAGPRPLLTDCAAESLPAGVELAGPPPGATDAQTILDALLHPGKERVPAKIPAPVAAEMPVPEPAPEKGKLPERAVLLSRLRTIFADGLGYPEEVLAEDAHLEADLGITSMKKTELLVQVLDLYELPTPPADLRIRDYNTLGKLTDLMGRLAVREHE